MHDGKVHCSVNTGCIQPLVGINCTVAEEDDDVCEDYNDDNDDDKNGCDDVKIGNIVNHIDRVTSALIEENNSTNK